MKKTFLISVIGVAVCYVFSMLTASIITKVSAQLPGSVELSCPSSSYSVGQLVNAVTGNYRQYLCGDGTGKAILQAKSYRVAGTPLTASNFAASAGWGSTANGTITVNVGTDSAWDISITASGAGQASNATITVTFADGPYATRIVYSCNGINNGTGAAFAFMQSTGNTTTATISETGYTPAAGVAHRLICTGQPL